MIINQWELYAGTWTMSFLSCLCLETPLPVGSSEMQKGAGSRSGWYFNIFKQMQNVCSREMCADSAAKKTDLNKKVGLYPCHNQVISPVLHISIMISPLSCSGWQPVLDAVKRGRDSSGRSLLWLFWQRGWECAWTWFRFVIAISVRNHNDKILQN